MRLLDRFRRDCKGNVAIIFSLATIPIIAAIGMSYDYTMAGRREVQMNAFADAAALSTTTPAAMALTSTVAQANAILMFNAQMNAVKGVTYIPANLQVGVVDSTSSSTTTRTTTVSYTATSSNAFSSMLHMATINIGGIAKAANSNAPNIDFYLLLDTSPSMGIPSSQSGIDTMVANTSKQGGCAFACHETNPNGSDNAGNPGGIDNYQLARNLGVTLRIDLIKQAAQNLISTAASTQIINKAVYRVATYTFDAAFTTITNLTTNLTQAQTDTSKIQMLTVYNDTGLLTANTNNNDEDTQLDQALVNTAYIPAPGKGTKAANDTPQEILFLVTDGVMDEPYPGTGPTDMTVSGRTITTIGHQYDYCTPLKARGVRIAVLYTTYNPLPTNGFYNQYVDPWQPTISNAMQACASPGLYFQVNTGGDINSAMQTLFAKAVASAHLAQ